MDIEIIVPEEVGKVLSERGITIDNVKEVIEYGEATKEKAWLPSENKFLAKKVIGKATFYAIYAPTDSKFTLHSAYAHRMSIIEPIDVVTAEPSDWVCCKCNEKLVRSNIDLEYLGIRRAAPGITCPKCKMNFIEEYVAKKTLVVAETLLEKKRA
jgi:hypothetical protein